MSRYPPLVHVSENAEQVQFDMPGPRRPLMALALVAWFVGWAYGVVFMKQQFFSGAPFGLDRVFLLVWSGFWLAAGGWGATWLAWLVAGRERVTMDERALHLRKSVFGVGFTQTYPLSSITQLRTFGREVPPLLAAGLNFTGRGASGVRFCSRNRTVRFARALDELTARSVVETLRARYPFDDAVAASAQPAA
ncbi:MAG: hypothetical protein U0704_11440 [Candidatus Eisenbacteria bacterium]